MKKITHFTIQFRSKNLTHFTNLNSFEIENNILPKYSQKNFSVYKFSNKHVYFSCQKKHLHCTISWRPRTTFLKHFESKCLYISVNLPEKMFATKTWPDVLVYGVGRGWIIFLKRLAVWVSWNDLQFFKLIEIFRSSTIFQYFDTFNNSIEALKCSRQFETKGKIVVKFLIRSHFLSI